MEQMKTPLNEPGQEASEILMMELDISQDEITDYRIKKQIEADRLLSRIGKLEDEIADLVELKREAVDFYDVRIERIRKQIGGLSGLLEIFTRDFGKTIKVPSGELKLYKTTSYKYPDNKTLLEFSHKNNIPTRKIEKEEPDKTAIKEFIKKTGEAPDGYEENTEKRFKINVIRGI